ncbi:YfhO family protein [Bacteroidota bacterium]
MKSLLPKIYPHVLAILVFLLIAVVYFSPVLEGKALQQSDIRQWNGMRKEVQDYFQETGERSLWTNSMFGGMPTYMISNPPTANAVAKVHNLLNLGHKRPVSFLFVAFLGFYITLLAFRVNPWLSIAGAIAYGFSTNFLLLIEGGHVTKVMAITYIAPIVSGVYLAFRGKPILGAVITGLFLCMQILVNHLQITYYTLMIILILGIVELIIAIKEKRINGFLKTTGILLVASLLAVGSNLSNFLLTYEYSKYSTRGESELSSAEAPTSSGLDPDYITMWSQSVDETLTLLIPNYYGGGSQGSLNENSETYKLFSENQGPQRAKQIVKYLPLYWGEKPFTGGPIYVGAGIFFLFILGIVLIKGPLRWWILSVSILAISLSWGRHFMGLTQFFIDHVPMYNKFRDVTTIMVIVQFTFPLLAVIVFDRILNGEYPKKDFYKKFKYVIYGVGGIALLFALMPGAFLDFTSPADDQYRTQGMQAFLDALIVDRQMLLRKDAFRSLIFVGLTAGLIYLVLEKKIKAQAAIAVFAGLMLLDMWIVDKRYFNNDSFVPKRNVETAYQPIQADLDILQDPDLFYRVYDIASGPFTSTRASYFHKSIGGYHGAKLRRYNEVIASHISKNNMDVLNMLNTKYFILPVQNGEPAARENPEALGNAWFVKRISQVTSADEEIAALDNFDPSEEAIIDERWAEYIQEFSFAEDSNASIILTEYRPNRLEFEFRSEVDQLTVFSDIYYEKGWNVSIDGEPAENFRANYILRAMVIPAGSHEIVFHFDPSTYHVGRTFTATSSILLLLLSLGILGWNLRNFLLNKNEDEGE